VARSCEYGDDAVKKLVNWLFRLYRRFIDCECSIASSSLVQRTLRKNVAGSDHNPF
jgi:hypothetical protein